MENPKWLMEARPCLVDGKKALWYRWVEISEFVPTGILVGDDHPGGFIKDTLALVEYEDGSVCKVSPATIQFLGDERVFNHPIYSETSRQKRKEEETK